jgi:hypothetical protein
MSVDRSQGRLLQMQSQGRIVFHGNWRISYILPGPTHLAITLTDSHESEWHGEREYSPMTRPTAQRPSPGLPLSPPKGSYDFMVDRRSLSLPLGRYKSTIPGCHVISKCCRLALSNDRQVSNQAKHVFDLALEPQADEASVSSRFSNLPKGFSAW